MPATVDAVLPAGGRISGDFAAEAGAKVKALIRFGEVTLLDRAITTLRECGSIGRIVVIGPEACREAASLADGFVQEADSGPENIRRGLAWLGSSHRVLVLTTDLPFVSAQAINAFLNACPESADISVPALTRQQYESRFPDSPAVYLRLRDGEWTA